MNKKLDVFLMQSYVIRHQFRESLASYHHMTTPLSIGLKLAERDSRCEFSFVSLDSFFILYYCSYALRLRNFEGLGATVVKLDKYWLKLAKKRLQVRVFNQFFQFIFHLTLL